ncbi:hypothetical protein QTP70_029012 [Hemibagrus guttatus]|uniref:Centromere protein Q n=1 Tax=Hemibagrus guttatus TaxID=175788 RepID=A0AAE0ULU9_9TELE|nr:hypothetical protein QTP70_029012 [Hemibagrus guttatus]
MKPARGSSRASTRGPKGAGRCGKNLQQKLLPDGESAQDKAGKKAPAKLRKMKGQEKWKPLDKSSIMVLDNMLSLSILSVLTMKTKEKEESQRQLNSLKHQFLAKCSQLPVPPQKHGNLMQVSQQFHTENQKVNHGKKKLEALEESSQAVVSQLEQLQGKIDRLEHECGSMRDKLEKEELNAQKCPPLCLEIAATAGTRNLTSTAPDGCVNYGGGEHCPLRLNVPNLPRDLVETLPEVGVEQQILTTRLSLPSLSGILLRKRIQLTTRWVWVVGAPAHDCYPKNTAPDGKVGLRHSFGLCLAESRRQRLGHQALACVPQPQAWLQGWVPGDANPGYPEDEPTLQEKIMKVVPDPKAVMKALQKRKVTGNVNVFLELAHKQTDHL